jgi:hypothetical protein
MQEAPDATVPLRRLAPEKLLLRQQGWAWSFSSQLRGVLVGAHSL